jgi:hypothetical protein
MREIWIAIVHTSSPGRDDIMLKGRLPGIHPFFYSLQIYNTSKNILLRQINGVIVKEIIKRG